MHVTLQYWGKNTLIWMPVMPCRTGGTVPMAAAHGLTGTGMRWTARERMTGTRIRAANCVARTNRIASTGRHRNAGTHRMARTGTASRGCLFIGLHDVHFLIRYLDIDGVQYLGIAVGFSIFLQSIIGSFLHFLSPFLFLVFKFYPLQLF